MANVWFVGDVHAGHKNIAKYRTEFSSEEESFQTIKNNYHDCVTKRDVVYFMGDTAFTMQRLKDISSWSAAKKVLILGNHDAERELTIRDLVEHFDDVQSLLRYKEFWLSHAPIHPAELRGRFNIHGHVHRQSIDDWRYINTCPEVTEYRPISLHHIRVEIEKRRYEQEQKKAQIQAQSLTNEAEKSDSCCNDASD